MHLTSISTAHILIFARSIWLPIHADLVVLVIPPDAITLIAAVLVTFDIQFSGIRGGEAAFLDFAVVDFDGAGAESHEVEIFFHPFDWVELLAPGFVNFGELPCCL